jgi:tetratricopeptide (TPR) repeat protein
MAHNRAATIEYAAAQRVDLWAPDHTELVYAVDDPRLIEFGHKERSLGVPLYIAQVDSHRVLVGFLPIPHDSDRFPILEPAFDFFRAHSETANAPWWAFANLGSLLAERGDIASARAAYERAVQLHPSGVVEELLSALLLQEGDIGNALAHVERALALRPDDVTLRLSFVRGLAEAHRYEDAFHALEEGLARSPGNISLWVPLARFYLACPDERLRNPTEALRIAERLRVATHGQDADVLATLSAAHEALGQSEDARRVAREAASVARSQGNTALAAAMERRAGSL